MNLKSPPNKIHAPNSSKSICRKIGELEFDFDPYKNCSDDVIISQSNDGINFYFERLCPGTTGGK